MNNSFAWNVLSWIISFVVVHDTFATGWPDQLLISCYILDESVYGKQNGKP